jgi:hypothetical protein
VKGFGTLVILYGAWLVLRSGIGGLIKVLLTTWIRRHGLPAVGTVSSTWTKRVDYTEPVHAGSSTPIYIPRTAYHTEALISFTAADGYTVTFQADLDHPDTPKPKGGPYELRYVATNPHVHRFTAPRFVSAWLDVLFGLASGGAFLWLGIWLVHQPK